MERLAEKDLLNWYQGKNRKPLILRGARQVGKSTLVKLFAKNQKLDLIEVNLEKSKINGFDLDEIDIKKIINEIEYKSQKEITKKSLLFFDEIQANPKALQALRYFYEDQPDIAVMAAGSLLEFSLNDHEFSMPVGRIEYYHLGPMTFTEYLLALGNKKLVSDLTTNPLETSFLAFDKLKAHLREFYYIGGMPEAVKSYAEDGSFLSVEKIHRSIIETYVDDFSKYATKSQSIHLGHLIKSLPIHLGKKLKYSQLLPDVKHPSIKKAITLLENAKIIMKCSHSNASGIPLSSQVDESVFKLYFLDIGLLNFLLGLDANDIMSSSASRLLNEGIMAEQFIAQHLKYLSKKESSTPLMYWLKDKKKESAEIDFLIQRSKNIIPIEVKSGKSGTLKSLHYFMMDKKLKKALRFDLLKRASSSLDENINSSLFDGEKQRNFKYTLRNLPLFLIEYIDQLL
jgi:predicted AAA+ superfamily ATPase